MTFRLPGVLASELVPPCSGYPGFLLKPESNRSDLFDDLVAEAVLDGFLRVQVVGEGDECQRQHADGGQHIQDDAAPVGDEEVFEPVVVLVEKGAAAAGGLDDVRLAVDAAIDGRRAEAGLRGDVGESLVKGKSGRLTARRRPHTAAGDPLSEGGGAGQMQERSACRFHWVHRTRC